MKIEYHYEYEIEKEMKMEKLRSERRKRTILDLRK
jgi:hypothetical protein